MTEREYFELLAKTKGLPRAPLAAVLNLSVSC